MGLETIPYIPVEEIRLLIAIHCDHSSSQLSKFHIIYFSESKSGCKIIPERERERERTTIMTSSRERERNELEGEGKKTCIAKKKNQNQSH